MALELLTAAISNAMRLIKRDNRKRVEKNSGVSKTATTRLRLSGDDRIRQLIQSEMYRRQVNSEAESFADADDFDLPDNQEWISPYEEGDGTLPDDHAKPANPVPTPPPAASETPPTPAGG